MISTRTIRDPLTEDLAVEAFAVLQDKTLVRASWVVRYIDLQDLQLGREKVAAAKTKVVQLLQEMLDARKGR